MAKRSVQKLNTNIALDDEHLSVRQYSYQRKTLTVCMVNLQAKFIFPEDFEVIITNAFENLAEYMNDNQVLYIRDIPELCIDEEYPVVQCNNPHEAIITIRTWGFGNIPTQHLSLAVCQALFQLAHFQNVGVSRTLGEEIFNQGAAAYWAEVMTGLTPPCAGVEVSKKTRRAALRRWDLPFFSYRKWFYEGKRGKWVGFAIGYELARAKSILCNTKDDLRRAVETYAKSDKYFVRSLNHTEQAPKRTAIGYVAPGQKA